MQRDVGVFLIHSFRLLLFKFEMQIAEWIMHIHTAFVWSNESQMHFDGNRKWRNEYTQITNRAAAAESDDDDNNDDDEGNSIYTLI